jgi:hypothetical protein
MKEHFCPAEKTTITYQGKCNWCGEQEALAQTELCKYGQEPKSCTSNPMDCQCAIDASLAQTQEPVAWIHNFIDGGISIGKRPADLNRHPDRWTALYKDPTPCQTCQALARTVMLDQTSLDTTPPQRTWVGLTDEDICMFSMWLDDKSDVAVFTAIEAKLKERNNGV